jgi:hypothetical protein
MEATDGGEGRAIPNRGEVIDEGVRLGLPREWLGMLPRVEELPGEYGDPTVEDDAFLVWKVQEHLVRTGRLAETDPALLAEALEDAAANDGPRWLHGAQRRLMFLMAWPRRNYHLHVELGRAVDHLRACLEEAPSMWLLVDESRDGSWQLARSEALGLDDTLDLPDACPWPGLDDLLPAAGERLATDRRRFP